LPARGALASLEAAASLLIVPAAALPGLVVGQQGREGQGGRGGCPATPCGLAWPAVCEAVSQRRDFRGAVLVSGDGEGRRAALADVFAVGAGWEGVRGWV
jgi:hypothetical protein